MLKYILLKMSQYFQALFTFPRIDKTDSSQIPLMRGSLSCVVVTAEDSCAKGPRFDSPDKTKSKDSWTKNKQEPVRNKKEGGPDLVVLIVNQ